MTKEVRKVSKDVQAKLDAMPTTCKKVWYLRAEGWEIADIARFLGISYQHANNESNRTAKNPR